MNDKPMPATPEEGYASVRDLIFDQVYKFHRRYGGDVDDLTGDAHVAFMRGHAASLKANVTAEQYPTEIRRWVWYRGMFDAMRVRLERKRNVKFSSTADQEDTYIAHTRTFSTDDFMDRLTPDGRIAASLVLTPPPEIEKCAAGKGGSPRNYKSTVRSYLRTMGWQNERINEAFEAIAGALV